MGEARSASGFDNTAGSCSLSDSRFSIDRQVARHTTALPVRARGMLGNDALRRIKDYVVAHLDEPIEVAALAGIAARSPFHFTRVFTQAVGLMNRLATSFQKSGPFG
jgi:AraC family transcriptional regulator